MNLDQSDLLDGEEILLSKLANSIIKIEEYGLSKFAFDQLAWTVGMKGKEAIGGKLHLTNYRLIFKSHGFNRVAGKFSIFLPTVQDVKNVSALITKKIEVITGTQSFEFIAWGIPAFIAAIRSSKDNLTHRELEFLKTAAASNYKKCGEGLQIYEALESLNVGLLTVKKIMGVVEMAQNPIELSSILNLLELFGEE